MKVPAPPAPHPAATEEPNDIHIQSLGCCSEEAQPGSTSFAVMGELVSLGF